MRIKIDDTNFFDEFCKHKKFILMVFRKHVSGTRLELVLEDETNPETKYTAITEAFSDVVFLETVIDEQYELMEYLNINDGIFYDSKSRIINPRIISFENGWKKMDQAGKMCYCLETLIKMIFDLHPELIPEPTSEG